MVNRSIHGNGTDPSPLHHRVYMVLRQEIMEGQFPADRQMPSELDFADQFGVSRITVRRALDRLHQEGLISRGRGKGTFPIVAAIEDATMDRDVSGIFDNLMAMGFKTQVEVLEHDELKAPGAVARDLDIAPGSPVRRTLRVRSHQGRPFSHLTTYVPMDVAGDITAEDLTRTPLLALIEAKGHPASSARQTISAKLADPITAARLQVETGTALIAMRRVVTDTSGRAVEVLEALYQPEIYEFAFELSRTGESESMIWQPKLF